MPFKTEENYSHEDSNIDIKFPVHIGPVFPCRLCQTNFINVIFLNKHLVKCSEKYVDSLSKLKFGSDPFKENNETATSRETSKKELVKRKYFQCEICNKRYSSYQYLIDHKKSHTDAANKPNLKKFVKIYCEEGPFDCAFCDKSFTIKEDLLSHFEVHNGKKPYACPLCNKSYSNKSYMNTHLRNHSGKKYFKCKLCHKEFSFSSSLSHHFKSHLGEIHKCEVCHQHFGTKAHLLTHSKIHSKIKTVFACDICDKEFSKKLTLRLHVRNHSKKYLCTKCDEFFTDKAKLICHSAFECPKNKSQNFHYV